MPRALSRRRLLALGVAQTVGFATAGCGTILHPERRGQPAGRLDWGIVALDAVGLLFFFVPGVIAFAVDFSNGTIYLPPERYSRGAAGTPRGPLVRVDVPADRLTRAGVEQVVSRHSGRKVALRPGGFETRPLRGVDEFWRVERACVEG